MTKKILLTILYIQLILFSVASNVDVETARIVAKNAYMQKINLQENKKGISDLKFDLVYEEKITFKNNKASSLYYIFNVGNNNGFVIVAADDDVYPVLGYSSLGKYTKDNQPPAFKALMDHYERQIIYVKNDRTKVDNAIQQEWKRLSVTDFSNFRKDDYINGLKKTSESKSVSPLVTTTWSQGKYYNEYCPDDAGGQDGHVLVGCVAVAMGQVMKYHNYPVYGTGSKSYTHSTYGYLYANFGNTAYDWGEMPDKLDDYCNPLAEILFHCGVSVEMDYGIGGSSAYVNVVDNALEDYFGYSTSAQYVVKSSYSSTSWEDLIKNELINNRPVVYRGTGDQGGHAFVCDGYNGSGEFHINWGWNGYYDGYFYLNNLAPDDETNFSEYQAAIIGIKPNSANQSVSIISPDYSTSWVAGTSQTITWSSTGISNNSYFLIEYYDGSEWIELNSSALNTGSANVSIPVSDVTNTNAKIRISLTTNPAEYDVSDVFTVEGISQSITVISPQSGDKWSYNKSRTITWETEYVEEYEYVSIELYDGKSWSTLTESTPNDGSYTISVPEVDQTTDQALVRISLASNSNINDLSNAFTIYKPIIYVDLTIDQIGVENCITAIENTFPEDNIVIFPNPNNGIFTISMKDVKYLGDIKMRIFDESGSIVYADQFNSVDSDFYKTIDLSDHKGVFIITLLGDDYKYSCKLVVK